MLFQKEGCFEKERDFAALSPTIVLGSRQRYVNAFTCSQQRGGQTRSFFSLRVSVEKTSFRKTSEGDIATRYFP
jgi:hypothetical protein